MNKLTLLLVLCALCLLGNALQGIGMNPIKPYHLNKGKVTKYLFSIETQEEINTKAKIKVTFPSQFHQSDVASNLTCMASSDSYDWISVDCQYINGSVVLSIGSIRDESMNILIQSPKNPTIYSMSSYFSICFMYENSITNCKKEFGKVVFPDPPITTSSTPTFPNVTSLNSRIVGKASTYEFKFTTSTTYSAGNTIRITLPPGFTTTANPVCQMTGTYNQIIQTFVWPDQRSIECQQINKTISTDEVLKIIGIYNPNYAGVFGNSDKGFVIEILSTSTTIVLEEIFAQKTVTIEAGEMVGNVIQANNFIKAKARYTYYLNLQNPLTSTDYIQIKMDNSWILYQNQCSIVSGIQMEEGASLECTNDTDSTYTSLKIQNFLSASVTNQLVFNIFVGTPEAVGSYNVNVDTANADGIMDHVVLNVTLNETYGTMDMLSINAITANSKVAVGATGPLELTFFLNYELPQTNVLTDGIFYLKIYPQIPKPPELVNGVLKCFFFNDVPAQTCTWDVSDASFTLVTIKTPETISFQYSQIPITITTEGAVNDSMIGITIDDKVTRYRFELEAYKQDNLTTPTEVYYSEYIADAIELPTTMHSLTKEVSEWTSLRIEYVNPYSFSGALHENIRLKVQFLAGGGWADNLGYEADRIYKRFPCVFYYDNHVDPATYDSHVSCDLYTYLTGPHASLTDSAQRGPYLLMYGFTDNLLELEDYRLELASFLIGSSTGTETKVRFSIIEETPDMLTNYIELYYSEVSIFSTVAQQISTPTANGASLSINNANINVAATHTNTMTVASNSYAVLYEYDMESTPSFTNKFVTCSTSNKCVYFGYPVNWIIQYHDTVFPVSITSTLSVTNGIYGGTFEGTARVFLSSGLTLYKATFQAVYTPIYINTIYFYKDTGYGTVYKGVYIYYHVYFDAVTSTPDNGFIRLTFSSDVNLSPQPYCSSAQLGLYESELGLLCENQNSDQTLKIYNINGLNAGSRYYVEVRLRPALTSSSSLRPQISVQTYYTVDVDYSVVNERNNHNLNQSYTNYYTIPNEFTIENPKVTQDPPRVGYIGKFVIKFRPSTESLAAQSIKVTLPDHNWNGGYWTTPNNVATDPMVCKINQQRVVCTYTLSPLIVTLEAEGINSGTDNEITLDTEYLTENGIKHPSQGGQYPCTLTFLDGSSSTIESTTFYHKVLPQRLRSFVVSSAVNDIGVQNMFTFQFQVNSNAYPRAYADGTTYSRIFIQFPTEDALGNALFDDDLGGYTKTGQFVGCYMYPYTNPYIDSPSNDFRCRLIKSEVAGDPVRVELINHRAFSSSQYRMKVRMARIYNPTNAVQSIPFSVKIEHVTVATNNVEELYYDTYHLFMNSQTPSPAADQTRNCNHYTSDIFQSVEVGAVGWFRFYPRSKGDSISSSVGYYYVIKLPEDYKPQHIEVNGPQYCHGSYQIECMAFPDINYIIIHSKSNNVDTRMYVRTTYAISQVATTVTALIWHNQRYRGIDYITFTTSCYNEVRGTLQNYYGVSTVRGSGALREGNRKHQVKIDFQVRHQVPAGGSIVVVWPSSIPNVYEHCRSMTNVGSQLYAEGGNYNGQIGCLVQNTRHWVITSFATLAAGSRVIIVGYIDLRTTYGYLGGGEVVTFNDTHPTNIRSNGFIIDYHYDSNFQLYVNDYPAMNTDGQITLEETLPLRVSHVGPVQFKFRLGSNFPGPNDGKIKVKLPKNSVYGVAGGFSFPTGKKVVCQIKDILTHEEYGCIVTDVTDDTTSGSENIQIIMISSTTLLSSQTYRVFLTTHTGDDASEGFAHPTVPGNYKIDFNFDVDGSDDFKIHDHLYMEVYGTQFSTLSVTSFVTIINNPNLIWIKLSPTTPIDTNDQIVIEIPTRSSKGTNLFANDLGTGLDDGEDITTDIIDGAFTDTFMKCRLFHGSQTYYKPAKVICGDFSQSIESGQLLHFAFKVTNPSASPQISIPFFIYSNDLDNMYKSNFNTVENSVYLRTVNIPGERNYNGYLYSGVQKTQTSGTHINLVTRNTYNVNSGEYYLLFFNFPLRNNGKITNGCTDLSGNVYGDAYYHENLWAIVCAVHTNTIGVPSTSSTTRNLRILGFYTPWFYLTSAEKAITTYAYNYNSQITTKGVLNDGYPNQSPKTSSNPTFSMTAIHQTSTKYRGARDDYKFQIVFSTTGGSSVDISYMKLIALIFPTSTQSDFSILGEDCVEAPTSQVEIEECWLEPGGRLLWIRPVIKDVYTSNMKIAVQTTDLAIRNPLANSSTNANWFDVKFYSWENISEPSLSPLSNNIYSFLLINNFASSTISYSQNPSSYHTTTFSYLDYPHQRYYKQIPWSKQTHRAPFELIFRPSVNFPSASGANYNQITIFYSTIFGDQDQIKSRDLQIFRPVCYFANSRIRQCTIDTTNNKITMSFQFALTANNEYHILFSLIDPRNFQQYGFLPTQAVSEIRFEYKLSGSSNIYYTETDKFPSLASLPSGIEAGPFRGIKDGFVEYGHAINNKINVINMKLTFNRTDITGLVFEFPLRDENGNYLYSSTSARNNAFLNLEDGSTYPCGNNGYSAGGNVKCFIFNGDHTQLTSPTKIIMTDFTYATEMNCRFIFTNPESTSRYFSVKVKAFGGTKSATNLYGDTFMGEWDFIDIFQTTSASAYYTTSYDRSTRLPSQSPWRDNTIHYVFSRNQQISVGRMSMVQILLSDSGISYADKQICEAVLGAANNYDDLLQYTYVTGGRIYKYAYFVRTWPSTTNNYLVSNGGWAIQYLKCKFYALSWTAYFFFSDNVVEQATNTFTASNAQSLSSSGISDPINKYYDQDYHISDGTDTNFMVEMDLTPALNSLSNFAFRNGDEMVLYFTFSRVEWGTTLSCQLIGGVISTSPTQKAYCTVANNHIMIRNVAGFEENANLDASTNKRVKFTFVGSSLGDYTSTSRTITTYLYANYDAYSNGYQAVFYEPSTLIDNCYYPTSGTCWYSHNTAYSYFELQKVTDTSIQAVYKVANTRSFGGNYYDHYFSVDFNTFGYGASCTVSSTIFQITTTNSPGTGNNNTVTPSSITCYGDRVIIGFTNDVTFSTLWGGLGAASDNEWDSNEYIIMYLTIAPGSDMDLPVLQHQYIYAIGVYRHYYSSSWTPIIRQVDYLPTQSLASSATFSTISNNRGGVTELSMEIQDLAMDIGSGNNNFYLLVQFLSSSGWTGGNDPFSSYTNTALEDEKIECKCISGVGPISISTTSPYVNANCRRRLPAGDFTAFAILIDKDASMNEDVRCFFPEWTIAAGMSVQAQVKVVYGDSYPHDITGNREYGSMFRVTTNTLSFSGSSPSMSLSTMSSLSQSPNFYSSSVTVGSGFSSTYQISGSWGTNYNAPYVYLNYRKAGPVPAASFCSDSNIFYECRVYNTQLNLVIAKIKSSSISSFTMSRGASDIFYPNSQSSESSKFSGYCYIGTTSWHYSRTLSRSQSSLAPISDNSFEVFSDLYGSSRSTFLNNLIISLNPSGQTLYSYIDTGSKITVAFSGITHKSSCQVWVQDEEEIELTCIVSSNLITIYSKYSDYTTSNNIFVSLGITNPSTSSVTFTMKMYDYYYSSALYSLVISRTTSWSIDNSYISNIEVEKSRVMMYPFRSRIGMTANSPLRIRFKLSTSSVPYATSNSGLFKIIMSEITHSDDYLIKFRKYASFSNMIQETQAVEYFPGTYSSSSTTLNVYPPKSHSISNANYYELEIMPIGIDWSSCQSSGCATQSGFRQTNFQTINFIAYSNSGTPTLVNQQYERLYEYEGGSKIALEQIYILCVQPTETSLYMKFDLNFTSSYDYPEHYLEFIFWDITETAFTGYDKNDQIPCQLSDNFVSIPNRQQPSCVLAEADNVNGFIKVRVINFADISQGLHWMTLDDITLPTPITADSTNKFDVSIRYMGPSNTKYENTFRQIFLIDGTNSTGVNSLSSASFSNPSITQYGADVVGSINFNWPFDTTSSGYESKVSINVNGGYSATWADMDTVTFVDTSGTYELLWVNKKLNKFVFKVQSRSYNVGTTINMTALNNPYPFEKQAYNIDTNVELNFYNNYFHHSRHVLNQPSFSTFTKAVPIVNINQNLPSNTFDTYPSGNDIASGGYALLRLNAVFGQEAAEILARDLNIFDIQFTAGLSHLEECRVVRNNSQYVNPVSTCQTYHDGSNWHIMIYHVKESQTDVDWWIQVLGTFSQASVSYVSQLKASNEVVEYEATYSSVSISNYYDSTYSTPTTLSWLNRKYVKNFYENQYRFLQAKSGGAQTPYLRFRFTVPMTHDGINDYIRLFLHSTTTLSSQTSSSQLICQLLPAVSAERDFSVGYYGQCSKATSGGHHYYHMVGPYGGWIGGSDYLLQISEPNAVTTMFNTATTPHKQDISVTIVNGAGTFYDSINIDYYQYFTSVNIMHTTTTVDDYDTLTVTYTPKSSISAFSSSREVTLCLSAEGYYFDSDGGLTSIFAADGVDIESGHRFSEVVSNPNGGEVTTIQFSQYSNKMSHLKLTLARMSAYTAGTEYVWRIPLLKNPSTPYTGLRYNLTLMEYPSSTNYGKIIQMHQSLNEYYTVADTSTSFNPSVTNTLKNVQVTSNIDLSINLDSESLDQYDAVTFKLDNSYEGLLSDFVAGNDTSNYDYYYFHTLNMVMAQKKNNNQVTTVGINSDSSSLDYQRAFKFAWVKIFDTDITSMNDNPKTLKYGDPSSITLDYLTTYSAATLTPLEGEEYEGSSTMYQLDITVPIIPEGGEIQIKFDSSKISTMTGAHCRVGSNFVRSSDDSQILRCYKMTDGFVIAGFQGISTGTSLRLYFYIKSLTTLTTEDIAFDLYGIYEDSTSSISKKASTVTVTHVADSFPSVLEHIEELVLPYYSSIHYENFYEIEGTLTLRNNDLCNGDSIRISDPLAAYGNMRFLIKKNDSNTVEWIELQATTQSTGSIYRFYLPTNYLTTHTLEVGTQYIWKYSTTQAPYSSSSRENGFIPAAISAQSHKFWYEGIDGGSVTEVQYDDFVSQPKPFVLTIVNRYPAASRKTVLDFTFGVDINAVAGDELEFTFDTNNLLEDMFANDLEDEPVSGETYKFLDCREWSSNSYISSSRMRCLLYYGDSLSNPPTPARLIVPLQRSINGYSGTDNVRFMIANVKNPSTENMNVGVQMRLLRPCINKNNKKCAYFAAKGYYVTTSANENEQSSATTFTPSSNTVLENSLSYHRFQLTTTAAVTSSDVIFIVYPENYEGQMPDTCLASNYYCYVFPTRRWVVLYPSTTVISGAGTLTITLSSYMHNPYYSQPLSENFIVTISRGSGASLGDVYEIYHDPFVTVKKSLTSNVATSLSISPTQTPGVYLRNYANTAIFTIDNIFMDSRIKSIYIKAPSDVTEWDADYCNASITATKINTYPLRFTCRVFDENLTNPVLQIIPETQDLQPYNAVWDDYTIQVHAKFTIEDFPSDPILYTTMPITSGNFHVYGSVNAASVDPKYYLSECFNTIQISQHQVPIISDINFNEQSFAYRVARVNNKEVFYLLLKPTESTANQTIGEMVFEIPVEFDYPGIFEHDNCFMIGRSKEDQDACSQSRQGGKTLIKIDPQNYDNDVKIIQLGSLSEQNWFTAPQLPGNFYNMTVELYSELGVLLEKQTIDISPVYGEYLDIPSIDLQNIKDGNIDESVYDLQFITGSLQIPPGAATTATTLTSEMRFIFENYNANDATNVFKNDLGTGLKEGDEVGCIIHQGITALQGKRISCVLHIGTNSTDKPMITILNYDYIDPATTISVSFGGIQSLNEVNVNTISIGVLIHYTDLDSSTYLYIPTATLPLPTNNTETINDHYDSGWHGGWAMTASYSGNNIVREPTNFTVGVRVPYWDPYYENYVSSGNQEDFVLVKFSPKYLIDPFNPTQLTCNYCTEVQMFYSTGIMRFRHARSISSSSYFYWTFYNLPSSAFTLAEQPATITIELYKNYRVYAYRTVNIADRTVEKCGLFDFGVISVSSLNGGQIGVTYTFSLISNHYIPENGAISITIPSSYGDMVSNGVTCSLSRFQGTNAYCLIQTTSRVDIYLNGSELSQTSEYEVILSGLQNPNQDSSGLIFYVSSYYDDNIYDGHKICENSVTPPTINVKAVRTCTLEWTASYVNKNFNAEHEFVVSCSDLFRGDSIIYITLPDELSTNNKLGSRTCTSLESTTLQENVCNLGYRNGSFVLWTSLEATTQTSLTIITNFINPTNNTYSATATILSKGVLYAQTQASYLTVLSTDYQIAPISNVFLMNSPKEAGLMATYIFKIAPVSSFIANNLGVTFPDNFFVSEDELTVGITTSRKSNLFDSLTYDNVQKIINNVSAVEGVSLKAYPTITTEGNSVFLANISASLATNEWTYVFIRGVKNPSEFENKNFTLTYYILSGTSKTLQWIFNAPLTYYISSPPNYLSINSVQVTDYDLLYPSVYTFNINADNGENIGIAGVELSFVIVIPNFYKGTLWANQAPTCKFNELSTTSTCSSYESQIIVTETFASNYSSLTLEIDNILNPALETFCDTTDITLLTHTFFRIRIIEVKSNKFLFESSSVVDGDNCLKFQSVRIPISLEHPLVMVAGLAYNITYGISRPASNLKIKASTTANGFTFSPNVIEFNDFYTLKKSSVVYLRSDISPGNYTINFQKFESEEQTYFRNILPTTVEIISPDSASFTHPTIHIPSFSTSTVGYPVVVPVIFSLPSSTRMSLFIQIEEELTQTLTQYSEHFSNFTLEPRVIDIIPQQAEFNFTITQMKRVVPPSLTLKFTLSSVYTIIHNLTTPEMILCFDQDPRYDVSYPPLRVSLTEFSSSCSGKDVGKTITNIFISDKAKDSSATSVKPDIIQMKATNTKSTATTIVINTRTSGEIYFLCIEAGYPRIKDADDILSLANTDGIAGKTESASENVYDSPTAQINHVIDVPVEKLTSSTKYNFYAVLKSELGNSEIKRITFRTIELSRGVLMKLTFNDIVDNLLVVKSLERILRISPLRIKVLTSTYDLQIIKDNVNEFKNDPSYVYEIVIAPDATNDTTTPADIVVGFINNQTSLNQFQEYIPEWDSTAQIPYHELRPVKPRVTNMPRAKVINLYNATFTMRFWERSNIYAVLLEDLNEAEDTFDITTKRIVPKRVSDLSANQQAQIPSSLQIRYGRNIDNTETNKYRRYVASTDGSGNGVIFFDDLKPGSKYKMCITSSSILPYEPTFLWEDDEVIVLEFETLHNPNLMKANRHIEELKKYKKDIGEAIERFIKNNEKKKNKYGRIRTN